MKVIQKTMRHSVLQEEFIQFIDLSKWVLMHLNEGVYGEGHTDRCISAKNHGEQWRIHTNMGYNAFGGGDYNTHYRGYGLGFNLRDENGYTIVQHSGGLPACFR